MLISRRTFTSLASLASVGTVLASPVHATIKMNPFVTIATWKFGLEPCRKSMEVLKNGGSVLDAVEQGIWIAEADTENRSVGIGGIPNELGAVELDACIMEGNQRRAGSIAALRNYPHPISVARRVMETTPHVMLAGEGAAQFAASSGFQTTELLVPREAEAFKRWQAKNNDARRTVDPVLSSETSSPTAPSGDAAKDDRQNNHDTIALLALGEHGHLAGGCSTSGWGYKLPGRVGDSPIIGGGLYVDDTAGAAGATGLGEIILRYCGSFLVVEAMRRGASPEDACIEAVQRILRGENKPVGEVSANFIALSPDGRVGAAGTDREFAYAVVNGEIAEVRQSIRVEK